MLAVVCLPCAAYVCAVLAHAPLAPGINESLETASEIPDPSKSWAIYGELHEGGEAQYYFFNVTKGQRILISLFKPATPEDEEFLPAFALLGPDLIAQGSIPSYVEMPSGAVAVVVNGEQSSSAMYEPFSPSSIYQLAELDAEAPASSVYYITVFEPSRGGHYGLAVGYVETFTISEWVLIPFSQIAIYQWERQSLALILAPLAATLVVGAVLALWGWRRRSMFRTAFAWAAAIVGLLFIGTGVMLVSQTILSLTTAPLVAEVGVTVLFALLPMAFGAGALRLSTRTRVDTKTRIYLAALGVAALFLWAGLIVGPVLAIVGSVLPTRRRAEGVGKEEEKKVESNAA